MPKLHYIRANLGLVLVVPRETLDEQIGALALELGPNLARAVDRYTRSEDLGYYPALGFFKDQGGLDPALLETADHVEWIVTNLIKKQLAVYLRPAFSAIRVDDVRLNAQTLPRVRPSHPQALQLLTDHYSPQQARVALAVTSIEKRPPAAGFDMFVRNKVHSWLQQHFDRLTITDTRLLEEKA